MNTFTKAMRWFLCAWKRVFWTSAAAWALLAVCLAHAQAQDASATHPTSTPPAQRLVGVAYTTWHQDTHWTNVWGTPLLGFYKSDNRRVIRQHARWLSEAGADFLFVDWSNNLGYEYDPARPRPDFDMIEGATFVLFDELAKMRAAGEKTPCISIFLGCPNTPSAFANGQMQRKANQVWDQFVANPLYRPLVQEYGGKPLLVVYVGTPAPLQSGVPVWNDPRFAVRYMTGFVTQQHALTEANRVSKYGYWSWEDRGAQTYPVSSGHPEAMVVNAAWRTDPEAPTPGRQNGNTFRAAWARARQIGPKFAIVVSFNEWGRGEQPSADVSKDIEPSREFGHLYLNILKQQVALFKAGQ